MAFPTLAIVVCLLGLVLYLVCGTGAAGAPPTGLGGKCQEIGRVMFLCGLLVFLLAQGGHPLRLG
jgi:hypothetical protein